MLSMNFTFTTAMSARKVAPKGCALSNLGIVNLSGLRLGLMIELPCAGCTVVL